MDDIIGEEDFLDLVSGVSIGDDGVSIGLSEIVGALPHPHAKALTKMMAAMKKAKTVDNKAVAVVERNQGPRRVKVLPVPPVLAIPAGDPFTVTIDTQELFRASRFVIPSSIAGDFVIQDIKIATQSMLAADGDVPGEIFRPDAVGVGIHFKTANPGEKIVIRGQNIAAAARDFRAAFIGTSVTD